MVVRFAHQRRPRPSLFHHALTRLNDGSVNTPPSTGDGIGGIAMRNLLLFLLSISLVCLGMLVLLTTHVPSAHAEAHLLPMRQAGGSIALTFDDGPSAFTPQILSVLRAPTRWCARDLLLRWSAGSGESRPRARDLSGRGCHR